MGNIFHYAVRNVKQASTLRILILLDHVLSLMLGFIRQKKRDYLTNVIQMIIL